MRYVLSLDNVSLDNGFLVTVVSRRRYRSCGRLSHHNNVEQVITYKNSEKILMTNVSQKLPKQDICGFPCFSFSNYESHLKLESIWEYF